MSHTLKVVAFTAFVLATVAMVVGTMGAMIVREPARWWWLALPALPLIGGVWWLTFRQWEPVEPTRTDTVLTWTMLLAIAVMQLTHLPPAGWWYWWSLPVVAVFGFSAWVARARGVRTATVPIVVVAVVLLALLFTRAIWSQFGR